jgi:hypothetical protein
MAGELSQSGHSQADEEDDLHYALVIWQCLGRQTTDASSLRLAHFDIQMPGSFRLMKLFGLSSRPLKRFQIARGLTTVDKAYFIDKAGVLRRIPL